MDALTPIRQLAISVLKQLGHGHSESTYHRAMEIELRTNNIKYETEKHVPIMFEASDGQWCTVGDERIDLYIPANPPQDGIVVELKAISSLKDSDKLQLKRYMLDLDRLHGHHQSKIGILINFSPLTEEPEFAYVNNSS